MNNKRIIGIAILLFAVMFSGVGFCEDPGHLHNGDAELALNVVIVNGSQDDLPVGGCSVLVTFFEDNKKAKQVSGISNDKGLYSIKDLPTGENVVAIAEAMYGKIAFSSRPVKLVHQHEAYELQVTVYDASTDRDAIECETHHIILQSTPNNIKVTEYLHIANNTNKAITSNTKDPLSKPVVIEMKLPKGFKQLKTLNYFNPKAIIVSEDGFHDTMAIAPGKYNAAFSYILEAAGSSYDFNKKLTLGTKDITVFAQLNGGEITGLGESQGQVVIQDGVEADYYTVEAGENNELSFNISGLTASKPKKAEPKNLEPEDKEPVITAGEIVAIILIIFAVSAAVILIVKKRKVR